MWSNVSLQSDHDWHLKVCVAIAGNCQIFFTKLQEIAELSGNLRKLPTISGNNRSTLTLQPETKKHKKKKKEKGTLWGALFALDKLENPSIWWRQSFSY